MRQSSRVYLAIAANRVLIGRSGSARSRNKAASDPRIVEDEPVSVDRDIGGKRVVRGLVAERLAIGVRA